MGIIKKGDKVDARWKGSRVYYPATVIDVSDTGYSVQFRDGTISSVKTSEIKTPSSESTAESRTSRNRSRSRGRPPKTSTSRSPTRRRSASREEKKTSSKDEKKSTSKEEKKSTSKEDKKSTSKEEKRSTSKEEKRSTSKEEKRSTSEEKKSTSKEEKKPSTKEERKSVTSKTKITKSKSTKTNHADEVKSTSKKEPSFTLKSYFDKRDSSVEARSSGDEAITSKAYTRPSSYYMNSTKQEVSYSVHVEDYRKREGENVANLRSSARIAALQTTKAATTPGDNANEDQKKKRRGLEMISLFSRDTVDGESEEESEEEEEAAPESKFSFLHFLGTFLKLLYLPGFLTYFWLACNRKTCSIFEVPSPYRWKEFQNDVQLPMLVLFAFHVLLMLLSKIPVGRLVSDNEFVQKERPARKYRLNGFYLLLLAIMTYSVLLYFDFYSTWIAKKIKPLVICSLIYTVLWSVIINFFGLLTKHDDPESRPPHRCGFLGSFYFGQEMNPRLFGVEDAKTRFIQFGLISLVLMDLSMVSKFLVLKNYVPVPLVLTVSMHILFVLEFFWREECMLTSATYTEEGVGYAFVVGIGSVIPFLFALQSFYISNYADKFIHLPHWCSASVALMFLLGLYVYDSSVKLKHNFRKTPFSPSLSKVTSIPTSRKRRLITSGLWGFVRHPNYLGLLIMVIACSLPCGFTHVLPYMPLLFFVILLALRSVKLDRRCREKYGPAWQNYTDMVRSRIIPYVF